MPLDRNELPPPDTCGYVVEETDGTLHIQLLKDFETKRGADRWAFAIVAAVNECYPRVEIDCSAFVTLSSTAIAGLVHLADELPAEGARLTLVNGSERVRRTLQMMHLDSLFDFA